MFSPAFILCLSTSPLFFVLSSSYSMFTFRFFASNADFASFSFFPTTPGTTTCGIPEPMLTCILTTSPAFAVEFASVS